MRPLHASHLSNHGATYNQPMTRLATALLISMRAAAVLTAAAARVGCAGGRIWTITYAGEQ
jgi:hypothetical protein